MREGRKGKPWPCVQLSRVTLHLHSVIFQEGDTR
jgi:hypothetical protein